MVLVSNVATMQQTSRAMPHFHAAQDDCQYIHLAKPAATASSTQQPLPLQSSSSSLHLEQSNYLANGFHNTEDHYNKGGSVVYRSRPSTRSKTSGNGSRSRSGCTIGSNQNTSMIRQKHRPRPFSSIIPSNIGNSSHHDHQRQFISTTENKNNHNDNQEQSTKHDSISHRKSSPASSLNFNHENLFYQPSIQEDADTSGLNANPLHINYDNHHRNNHQQHIFRPHQHHSQSTQATSTNLHSHSSISSLSHTMSDVHLSSSHPVQFVPPTVNIAGTEPTEILLSPSTSPSLSSSSSPLSASSSKPAFQSVTLPRSYHGPSPEISKTSSSDRKDNTSHRDAPTKTRTAVLQSDRDNTDLNVMDRQGDHRKHDLNSSLSSPVSHSDTPIHSAISSIRSKGNKTHQDPPYHYQPKSLIYVGPNKKISQEANKKNGRHQTIEYSTKVGACIQSGPTTNTTNSTENNSKFEVSSSASSNPHCSASATSNKRQTTSNHSPTDSTMSTGLSAVLDIPMSSLTRADSWSPNYIKMDFFLTNGDSFSSSTNSLPISSSGFPSTRSNHTRASALRNGYKSHILSNSFDSSTSTRISSRLPENVQRTPQDSSQESISRSDNSFSSSQHEQQNQIQQPTKTTTHHARLFTISKSSKSLPSGNAANSVRETFPPKVKGQFLRRAVSHEPREIVKKHPVIRTASDGEIESEYVTLDESYIPLNNTGLCRVNEIVVNDSNHPHPASLSVLSPTTAIESKAKTNAETADCFVKTITNSEKNQNIKRIHNPLFTNEDSNMKLDVRNSNSMNVPLASVATVTNSVKPKRSMRQNVMNLNSFPDNTKRQSKNNATIGRHCIVVENMSGASSSHSDSLLTLPRTRSSCVADVLSSPSSFALSSFDNPGPVSVIGGTNRQYSRPLNATPKPKSILIRSKSLPDFQKADEEAQQTSEHGVLDMSLADSGNNFYSDDEDCDEFGFLSYPISFSPPNSLSSSAVMQKAKSPSPTSRILPKRWRSSKSKAVPGVTSCAAMWTPGPLGSCMWSSMSGRKVILRPVSILSLSEAERIALQKVAYSKLQDMALDCLIVIPKDATDVRRSKKSGLSLKRRSKSVNYNPSISHGKESVGVVFGIPITKCLRNDREREKKRRKMHAATVEAARSSTDTRVLEGKIASTSATPTSFASSPTPKPRLQTEWAENVTTPCSTRKSSCSSQGSLEKSNSAQKGARRHDALTVPSCKRAPSSESLSESESSRNTSSSLIDALSLSASCPASRLSTFSTDRLVSSEQRELQVPYLVTTCFKHIQTYGLQTLGIFRVGCSKKRVKELREQFDSGQDVELKEEHHSHDVAALLKEYFRDLPEPLLTRELYLPFLHAKRLSCQRKRSLAIQLLISMLPMANRDTLWSLLQFLATVSQHAGDSINERGEKISGNKMDSHNLATLFGPNILHRTRSPDKDHGLESAESVVESKEVIQVVKEMIECAHELYEISSSLRDDALRLIVESDQETADRILKQLANQNQIEADPESMCSVFEDSIDSPVLSHGMNSDADFFAHDKRHTSASQRPLRVTKSVEGNLDSPVSKARATHLSESYASSSTHNLKIPPSNTHPSIIQDNVSDYHHQHPRPTYTPNRIPILQLPHESSPDLSATEVVLRSPMDLGSTGERPYSESFSQNLSIPRPIHHRESSNTSVNSSLSSSINSYQDSDGNTHSGYWALPTPPVSRGASPKPIIRSASSSSTLIASAAPAKLRQWPSGDYEDNRAHGSPEWDKERWHHWELMASENRNAEVEQETLV